MLKCFALLAIVNEWAKRKRLGEEELMMSMRKETVGQVEGDGVG